MYVLILAGLAFTSVLSGNCELNSKNGRLDFVRFDLGVLEGENLFSTFQFYNYRNELEKVEISEKRIERIAKMGADYLLEFNYTKSRDKAFSIIKKIGLPVLAYYTNFPLVLQNEDILRIPVLLGIFIFLYDDLKIDSGNITFQELERSNDRAFEILSLEEFDENNKKIYSDDPFESTLFRFMSELRKMFGYEETKPLVDTLFSFFYSLNIQLKYKQEGKSTSEELYLNIRDFTSSGESIFELEFLLHGVVFTKMERLHPLFKSMMKLAVRIISHHNDIFSLATEFYEGISFNLVFVKSMRKNITIKESIESTTHLVNSEFESLLEIENELEEKEAKLGVNPIKIRNALEVIYYWIFGNLIFGKNSPRYRKFDGSEKVEDFLKKFSQYKL